MMKLLWLAVAALLFFALVGSVAASVESAEEVEDVEKIITDRWPAFPSYLVRILEAYYSTRFPSDLVSVLESSHQVGDSIDTSILEEFYLEFGSSLHVHVGLASGASSLVPFTTALVVAFALLI